MVLTYTALHFSMISQQWIWTELVHMVDITYELIFAPLPCWKRNVDFLHTGITCSSSCRCRSMCTSMQLILERDSSFGVFFLLLLFFMHLISQVLLRKQSGPNGRINWKHRSVRRWDYGVLSLLVRFPLILVSFSSKSFTDSIIQRENYTSRSLGPICDKCSSEDKKKYFTALSWNRKLLVWTF